MHIKAIKLVAFDYDGQGTRLVRGVDRVQGPITSYGLALAIGRAVLRHLKAGADLIELKEVNP